jgi:hypothetical protein
MQNYKRFFTAGILMILFVALVMVAAGQANAREDGGGTANALPQNSTLGEPGVFLTGPNDGEPLTIALDYIRENAEALGLSSDDLADLVVTDQYTSQHNGVTHIYLRQRVNGLELFGSSLNINIARDGSIINVGNRTVAGAAELVNGASPSLTAEEAVSAAANHLGLTISEPLVVQESLSRVDRKITFSDGGISLESIPVRLVYQPTARQGLRLSWDLSIYELSADNWWSVRIDAETGDLLSQDNWVVHEDFLAQAAEAGVLGQGGGSEGATEIAAAPARGNWVASPDSYLVYTLPLEAPHFTTPLPPADARVQAVDPANGASPFGWHDTDGVPGHESEYSIGNNVDAFEDIDGNNMPNGNASRAFGGPTLEFSHTINLAGAPNTYIQASVTNLFYWSNIIHDVMYGYGFDEASGNFQTNNYGNGGLGGDAVVAHGQSGVGNCNANFGTPSDGNPPRMRMYTCTNASPARDGDLDNGVIIHEYGHGISNRLTGGPATAGCLSNLEQMGEGWSDFYAVMLTMRQGDLGTDARPMGTYLFGQGPGGAGIRPTPYSTDTGINPTTYGNIGGLAIPHGVGYAWATMLWEVNWNLIDKHGFNPDSYGDWTTGGNNLTLQLVTDGMKMQPCNPGFVDGRNAILAADMALTGGDNQCEIWAGFAKRGLGFDADQGSSNSTTDGTENFDTHPACAYIGVEIEDRALDICTGDTADYQIIIGENFTPDVDMTADGHPAGTTASFSVDPVTTVPSTTTLTIGNTGSAAPGDYTVTITGTDSVFTSAQTTVDLTVYDAVPAVVSLTSPADGAMNVSVKPTFSWAAASNATGYYIEIDDNSDFSSPVVTATVTGTSFTPFSFLSHDTTYYWRVTSTNVCGAAAPSTVRNFTTEILAGTCAENATTIVAFEDDLESGAVGWTHMSNPDTDNTGLDTWILSSARTSSGVNAWYAQDTETKTDQLLISPEIDLPGIEESPITLYFSNFQFFEVPNTDGRCWDAGILEVTTDGGTSWAQVPNGSLLTDPYDNIIWNSTPGNNPITEDYGATQAWCPNPPPQDWLISAVDLDAYAGETVQFRWRLGTDSAAGNEGWYIDDIAVQSCEAPAAGPTLYLPAVFKAPAAANETAALPFGGLVLLPAMVGLGFFSYWRRNRSL